MNSLSSKVLSKVELLRKHTLLELCWILSKKWPEKFQELNLVWQILVPLRESPSQGFIEMVGLLQGYLIPNYTELLLTFAKKWGSGGSGNWREGSGGKRRENGEKKQMHYETNN